jgi:hypothetical protein
MDRRTVLKTGLAAAGTLAMPAYLRAQSNKKISILTWNIADQEALFKQEFEDFKKAKPSCLLPNPARGGHGPGHR